jgi:hypothetical protein
MKGGNLRKTARGASSPAKPALHIPELSSVSDCPSHFVPGRLPCEGCCGSLGAWAEQEQTTPPWQGWQQLGAGGTSLPIVDNEGCDFLCRDTSVSRALGDVERIEDDGQRVCWRRGGGEGARR